MADENGSGKKARAVKVFKIDELQHTRKVKKSGTAGTATVAKAGDVVMILADAIHRLPADERCNNVISAFNRLVRYYDGVILLRAQPMHRE